MKQTTRIPVGAAAVVAILLWVVAPAWALGPSDQPPEASAQPSEAPAQPSEPPEASAQPSKAPAQPSEEKIEESSAAYDPGAAGHPLRMAAYVVHPIGVILDVLIFRPFYWIGHFEPFKTLFGQTDEFE